MSKIARPTRPPPTGGDTGQQNVKNASQKPSTSSMKPTQSKAGTSKAGQGKKTEFALPAFSIAPKKPKAAIDWDLVKRDMARRQAPEGEDVRSIKRVLHEIADKKIPVHEFINLVSPYTSDNGAVLRTVMTQDVDSFRKLARKVYETMTQDVSDVLVNEQLNLMRFYDEKHDVYTDKMMNAINQIYEMAPKFDFDRFLKDRNDYLNMILPLPADHHKDEEEIEMQKRQQAYHRLLWLRSEGERMATENKRLQARLKELKQQQDREQDMAAQMAAEAETKRQELVKEEAHVKDHLDTLSRSVEKKFVQNEALANKQFSQAAMGKGTGGKAKKKGPVKKKRIKRPEWVSDVATDIDQLAAQEVIAVESEAVPPFVPPPTSGHHHLSPRQRSPQMQQYPQQMQQQRQPTPQMQQQPQFQQRQPSPQMVQMQPQQQQRHPSPAQMQQPMQQRQPSPPQMQQAMPPRQPSPAQMQQQMQQRQPSPAQMQQPMQQQRQPSPPQMQQAMPPRQASPQMYQQQMQMPQTRKETRIEQASTTTQIRRGRRVAGPRDTWGGFY